MHEVATVEEEKDAFRVNQKALLLWVVCLLSLTICIIVETPESGGISSIVTEQEYTFMSDIDQEGQLAQGIALPVKWNIPDDIQSRYVNNVLVQSGPYEIIISFFETQYPPLVGSSEENKAKLEQLGAIQANCVSRIVVSPDLLPAIIDAIQTGLNAYLQTYRASKTLE